MPRQYIPIMIYAVLAAAFPAASLAVFKLIRPDSRADGAKLEPYECGVPAESGSRGRYSVRFYIIAILFVIFDVEITFLFPGPFATPRWGRTGCSRCWFFWAS